MMLGLAAEPKFRQSIVAELFEKSRAAVCKMYKRHSTQKAVFRRYLSWFFFWDKRFRIHAKKWRDLAKSRADVILRRAQAIEERRRHLEKTNANGLVKYVKKIINEIYQMMEEVFFHAELKKKSLIFQTGRLRNLVFKAFEEYVRFLQQAEERMLEEEARSSSRRLFVDSHHRQPTPQEF